MAKYVPINDLPAARNPTSRTPGYPRSVSTRTCLKRRCRYFQRISKVSIAAQSILSTRHSLSLVYRRWTERNPGLHFLLTRRKISPYDFNPRHLPASALPARRIDDRSDVNVPQVIPTPAVISSSTSSHPDCKGSHCCQLLTTLEE